jgi:hypothetical protein
MVYERMQQRGVK